MDGEEVEECPDSGCGMSLVDREFLTTEPHGEIRRTTSPLRVRGIGDREHDTSEYCDLDFYVTGTLDNGAPAVAHFKREVHVVDDLRAKVLIGTDILGPEAIVVDVARNQLVVGSCGITAPLSVTPRRERVERKLRSQKQVTIPPHTVMAVPVKYRGKVLPNDRDYSFLPRSDIALGSSGGFFAHIVDANVAAVQVRNASNRAFVVPKNLMVGALQDYDEDGCYLAHPEDAHLAVTPSQGWSKRLKQAAKHAAVVGLAAVAAFGGSANTPTSHLGQGSVVPQVCSTMSKSTLLINTPYANTSLPTLQVPQPYDSTPPSYGSSDPTTEASMETMMPNGITIYGDGSAYNRLSTVAEEYQKIFRDSGGTVDLPEEQWMQIPTLPGAKPDASRVYPLSPEDKKVVNKEFDRLHTEEKMSWTTQPTEYGYPVFVVWRTVNGIRKGRVVVDIRGLNKISIFDAYPMPLQSDVLAAVMGFPYISVMDCASFFHQWLVRYQDRHELTVVSHRGSEQWNVAVMGYRNSPAYVQRQIDAMLRPYDFARAYVDDVVVYSSSLEEHLRHLNEIFSLFKRMNIAIKPSKTFLGYPTIALLGQKVDSLGLTTAEDKLSAIRDLQFPRTLKHLETYLGKTGYLRQYVPYYAQKAEALQARKTRLLRGGPTKGAARKRHSQSTVVNLPGPVELDSFNQLQGAFTRATFLTHYDRTRTLFVDLDASKERGYGVMVYHVKRGKEITEYSNRRVATTLNPSCFLARSCPRQKPGTGPLSWKWLLLCGRSARYD
jgi:hypothetical protein